MVGKTQVEVDVFKRAYGTNRRAAERHHGGLTGSQRRRIANQGPIGASADAINGWANQMADELAHGDCEVLAGHAKRAGATGAAGDLPQRRFVDIGVDADGMNLNAAGNGNGAGAGLISELAIGNDDDYRASGVARVADDRLEGRSEFSAPIWFMGAQLAADLHGVRGIDWYQPTGDRREIVGKHIYRDTVCRSKPGESQFDSIDKSRPIGTLHTARSIQ